jgi:hypothetical protein
MKRTLVTLALISVSLTARAQPAPQDADSQTPSVAPGLPPAEPEPAPTQVAQPAPAPQVAPATPVEQCRARRRSLAIAANRISDQGERTRRLLALPDCGNPEVVRSIAGTGEPTVQADTTDPEARGSTSEVSIGLGMLTGGFSSKTTLAGLNLGVGGFVSHDVALSLRLSGVTLMEGGFAYVGVIGPHAQLWFAPQAYVGFGLGVGFVVACGGGGGSCDGVKTSGFELRLGYAFDKTGRGGNASVEVNSLDGLFGSQSLETVSFLLGYQSF